MAFKHHMTPEQGPPFNLGQLLLLNNFRKLFETTLHQKSIAEVVVNGAPKSFTHQDLLLATERWIHFTSPDYYEVTSHYISVKALHKSHSSLLLHLIHTVLVRCAIMYIPINATPHEAWSVDLVVCD